MPLQTYGRLAKSLDAKRIYRSEHCQLIHNIVVKAKSQVKEQGAAIIRCHIQRLVLHAQCVH